MKIMFSGFHTDYQISTWYMGNVESSSDYPDIDDIELIAKKTCLLKYRQEQAAIKERLEQLQVKKLLRQAKRYRYRRIIAALRATDFIPLHLQQSMLQMSGIFACHCVYVSVHRGKPVGHYRHSNCTLPTAVSATMHPLVEFLIKKENLKQR